MIEELACNAVKELLFEIPEVQPFLNSNDKEPSWDGNIYMAPFENGSKRSLTKIQTQIKGHVEDAGEKQEISFPVEMVDLDNYYRNGGCFFFVVYISLLNHKNKTIFYSSLLPYDLRKLLQNKGGQKTISIKMKRFPLNRIEGYNVLLNFSHNAVLQASFCSISDEDFEEACNLNQGNIVLSLSYKSIGDNYLDPFLYLSLYQYRESGFGTKIPIGKQENIASVECEISKPVCCENKIFFNSFRLCRERDIVEFKIGAGISIKRNEKEMTQKFNYTPKGNLEQRISDMEFFLALIQVGSFYLDNMRISTEIIDQFPADKVQEEMATLNSLKTLQQAFIKAGYNGVVDIESFTDEDWNKCDILINSFINNKSQFHKKNDGFGFFIFTVGQISLLLFMIQNGKNKQVLNPYTSSPSVEVECDNKRISVSPFCLLNEETIGKVSKFDFAGVMKNITAISMSNEYHEFLVQMLLKMLRIYDSHTNNDPDMLVYAQQLAQWLFEQYKESAVDKINLFQVHKRQGANSIDEISSMHKILESPDISDEQKAGIYILLSDEENFIAHFDKLNAEQKKFFIDYPIFNLLPVEIKNAKLNETRNLSN